VNIKTTLSAMTVLFGLHHGVMAEEVPYNWTGAYAGLNIGVIWAGSALKANQINLLPDSGTYSVPMTSTAVNPGLQLGYLYQIDEHWVVGGEGDFTYPATNSQFNQNLSWNGSVIDYDRFNVHYNMQGSLRGRVGYAIDRFLPFFTTGVSFAGMGMSYANAGGNYYSKSTTQTGFVVGAGLEYGFLDNLSGRLEYLYSNYGNAINMGIPSIEGVSDPAGAAHATMNTNVLRAAVNYRF
jgi:outer membrane immunogenic protein